MSQCFYKSVSLSMEGVSEKFYENYQVTYYYKKSPKELD